MAQKNLYDMCVMLKQMRDDKLYKELGYYNFEEYCEEEIGISRHMAYKYADIADMKNVESIQHFGVTKLSLLASFPKVNRKKYRKKSRLKTFLFVS